MFPSFSVQLLGIVAIKKKRLTHIDKKKKNTHLCFNPSFISLIFFPSLTLWMLKIAYFQKASIISTLPFTLFGIKRKLIMKIVMSCLNSVTGPTLKSVIGQ